MAIKEVTSKDENWKDLLQSIGKRKKKAEDRQAFSDESIEGHANEKKPTTQQKKKYKSFMKVASVLLIIGLGVLGVVYFYVPNIYQAVVVFLKEMDPLAIFKGTSDLGYYAN
jgi:CDP-glycerol glycerophosphotransferase (TagB/SpsB family)